LFKKFSQQRVGYHILITNTRAYSNSPFLTDSSNSKPATAKAFAKKNSKAAAAQQHQPPGAK
jgi:hypothetical protein